MTVETIVTPWKVESGKDGINYEKLIDNFGCSPIDDKLITEFERVIGQKAHILIRRKVFFAHRDLQEIINCKIQNIPIYLYTGRGPSSEALHIGHLIPFMLNQWLQEVLNCPIVIQLTDDEKFLFKKDLPLSKASTLGMENAKDILACGFDVSKTFIFKNTEYIGELYKTVLEISKRVTFNQIKGIFGFDGSQNIGCNFFPAIQAAPSFPSCFPKIFGTSSKINKIRCLIPCAIDQDPYFRMTRDVADKINFQKPCLILSKFIPALRGSHTKMSGSSEETAVYISDNPKQIKKKINKYCFSGGQDTIENHRLLGANLEIDVAYQYLTFFLEDDDELERIKSDYKSGKMLTSEVKQVLINCLVNITDKIKNNRAKITQDILLQVMNPNRPDLVKFYDDKIF